MAVQPDQKDFYNFVAGLNSEAGWFTAPPNTWQSGDNVIPGIDGILRRRTNVDYEDDYTLTTVSGGTELFDKQWAYTTGKWNAVGGDGDKHVLVVQVGYTLYFYNALSGTVSGRLFLFTIDLSIYKVSTNPNQDGVTPIRCTPAAGKLIITSSDTEPILLTWVDDTTVPSVDIITLQIRDFVGVEDNMAINYEPDTTPSTDDEWKHEYNLRNQGWTTDTLTTYRATGTSPSNVQSWIYGKNTSDDFDAALLKKQDFGTSPAPKGRFILDAFNRDREAASSSAVSATYVPTEVENYRPSCCAFFAGRAWYAGVIGSNVLNTYVLFSQVATADDKFGKCYQEQDPTSEVLNDLVDSDGGVIPIQDAGEIVSLVPTANGVIVFATNGIWKIAGTANTGFAATGYEVTKISAVGVASAKSIVITDGGIMFWAYNGIYAIEPNQNTGNVGISNYSDNVIKTKFNSIASLAKKYVEGVYNPADKLVTWVYEEDLIENGGSEYRFRKNRALVFDVRLKAFYTLSFGSLASYSPYIFAPFVTEDTGEVTQDFDVVTVGSDTVIHTSPGTDKVLVNGQIVANGNSATKFMVSRWNGTSLVITVADMLTTRDGPDKWFDWKYANNTGVEELPYVETSYVPGPTGFSKNMQALYVTTFMSRTETSLTGDGEPVNGSGCLMRGKWEFSDNAISNKWGAQQQIYRIKRLFLDDVEGGFENGYPLVIAKSKVRGRGKALQLRFDCESGKDMQLAGWSIVQIGNTNV